jgi:hypothetical protein
MLNVAHLSVGRHPVGVHVEEAHENAHHNAPVVEIFVLIHFLDNYDATVAGRNDNALCLTIEETDGAAEEIHYYKIHKRTHNDEP